MRPNIRPPPKVVPPKPPAHLFEPSGSNNIELSSAPRDHVRGMPSPRMGDLNTKPSLPPSYNNSYDRDLTFHPSHGPPQRTLPPGSGSAKFPNAPMDRDRIPPRDYDDMYRKSNTVAPSSSSKVDFAKDVEEQMKRLEEDMLKLMIENGELEPPPAIYGTKPSLYDDRKDSRLYDNAPPSKQHLHNERRYGDDQPKIANVNSRAVYPNADPYVQPRNQPWDQSPRVANESPRMNEYDSNPQGLRGNASPVRRKGGAIANLYETDDHLRLKAEKQALYSQQLQQQMRDKVGGAMREPERRVQVDNRNQRLREEGPVSGLAIGLDKNKELELKRQKQMEYRMQLDQQATRKPREAEGGTGLALGMDKDREAALRRQKQLQYKQQLDEQQFAAAPPVAKSARNYPPEVGGGYPSNRGDNYESGYDTRYQSSDAYSRRELSPRYDYPPQHDPERRYQREPASQFEMAKERTPSKSITNPLSIEEKESKKSKQDDYRKQLDEQKKERERQKEEEKKKLEENERRFMSQFEGPNAGDHHRNPDKKQQQQQPQRAYPADQSSAERERAESNRLGGQQSHQRSVSFQEQHQIDPARRFDNDYYSDRKQSFPHEVEQDYRYDRDNVRDRGRDTDPYVGYRQASADNRPFDRDDDTRGYYSRQDERPQYDSYNRAPDTDYPPKLAEPPMSETSPSKSPKPARNQLVQDIYGRNSILSHRDENVKDSWKPSGKNSNDRQRAAINEQKAALDRQKAENERLKEEEKRKAKEEEEKLEKKIRADIEAEQEHTRLEREKKQKLAQDNQREMEDMQQRKEKEALARKGLSENNNKLPSSIQKPNAIPSNSNYDHIKSPLKGLMVEYDRDKVLDEQRSPPRPNYRSHPQAGGGADPPRDDAIDSFVRNYEQKKPFLESPKRPNNLSTEYDLPPRGYDADYRAHHHNQPPPRDNRDYPPRERDEGLRHDVPRDYGRDYSRDYPPRDSYPPLRSYPPQNRDGYGYHVDESYSRDMPPNGMAGDPTSRSYEKPGYYGHGDVGPSPYRPVMDYPQKGLPGNHYSPGNDERRSNRERVPMREEVNEAEVSFVSESRFIPANPWSSDIVSSLLPLHSVPEHIRKTKGELSYVPPYSSEVDVSSKNKMRAKQPVDLEQSLASDSLLMYVGPKTPNVGLRNPRSDTITSSPPMKASISTTVNKEVVALKESHSGLSQTSLGRSKTPERLDPASLPVAGRPTSRHESVEVKRVITQPIVPSADEVPTNRIFVNKVQNNSPLLQPDNPPPRNPSHLYPEPSDTYFGVDEHAVSREIELTNPSFEHKADDIPQRHHRHNILKANSDMLLHNKLDPRSPHAHGSTLNRTNDNSSGSRPSSSNHNRTNLMSGGSKKGWDVSNESRNETIKQLTQHVGHDKSHGDDAYEESFESA